jgi:hypothetical protein
VGSTTVLAQQTDYWLAGTLTILAAVLVTIVILVSSHSNNDKTPQ